MRILKNKQKKAFTLVEVMLAVGVITVSLTALLALLGGITSSVSQIRKQAKAMTVIDHVSTILKMMDFETVYTNLGDPSKTYMIYFWDEYSSDTDLDNKSLILRSSEDAGRQTEQAPSTAELSENVVGDVFRVVVSLNDDMLDGKYLDAESTEAYAANSVLPEVSDNYTEAYLPLRLDIFSDPKSSILDETASDEENNVRRVMEDTVMKMR